MGLFRKTERERETSPSVATWEQGIDLVRFDRLIEAGIRLRLRAYNAFLQGQFRHSDVRAVPDDVERVIVTAWIGFTVISGSGSGWRLSYRLQGQSPELRRGAGSRNHFWGSLTWTRPF